LKKHELSYGELQVLTSINSLSGRKEEMFILFVNGYSNDEMSETIGVHKSNVSSTMLRVREHFDVSTDRKLMLKVLPTMVKIEHKFLGNEQEYGINGERL